MPAILLVHVLAGGLAILAGYAALLAAKGAAPHRGSGTAFVRAMVVMGLTAPVIAASPGIPGSGLGGVFPVYLVVTALTTVRRPDAAGRRPQDLTL